jgi:fucose 4-O-acetylase-like acetyltransferase
LPVERQRLGYIETARGIACILVVAYHVVGNNSTNGLQLPRDHWLALLNALFGDLRMPLFSFISGFIFAPAVRSAMEWKGKVRSKARRLLIPLVAVSTLHFLLQSRFATGSDLQMWQIYFLPYEHFWFLQATFILMLVTLTGSLFLPGGNFARYAPIAGLIGALVYIFVTRWRPDVFSGSKVFYLAPYFFTGLAFRYWYPVDGTNPLAKPVARFWVTLAAVALFMIDFVKITGIVGPGDLAQAIGVAVGMGMCLLIVSWRPNWRFAEWMGGKSYAIFLFHVFFTAGSRIALAKIWSGAPLLLFVAAGIAAGLTGPIILDEILMRSRITALLFLGLDLRPRSRKSIGREQAEPIAS